MNIADAVKSYVQNIGQQAKAVPEFVSQKVQGSHYQQNYLPPQENKVPMPPIQKPIEAGKVRGRNPATEKANISAPVYDAIYKAAETYGVPSQLLFDLAMSEGSFDPQAVNKNSSASGLFMFTDGTWNAVQSYAKMPNTTLKLPSTDRFDPLANAMAAAYLIKFGQLGRWNASKDDENNKNSWGNWWNDNELEKFYSQTLTNNSKE